MPVAGLRQLCSVALAFASASACSKDGQPVRTPDASSTVEPADSLALRTSEAEIWYTLARSGTGPDGGACVERGLEIRRGSERIAVPLLYTGQPPTLVNDTTLRATLWTDCRPREAYLVNLRNGRPVREQIKE
jgi:hypothetical protein